MKKTGFDSFVNSIISDRIKLDKNQTKLPIKQSEIKKDEEEEEGDLAII